MVSPCTIPTHVMPSLSGMVGIPNMCLPIVFVELPSPSNTHCLALRGGFSSLRHNEIRDLTADLLSDVCLEVCVELHLQPLSGKLLSHATANREDNAHLDISACGFWGGSREKSVFDVRVFNHLLCLTSSLHCPLSTQSMRERESGYMVNELEKWSLQLSPPWCSHSLVVWAGRHPASTRD